MVRMHLGWNSQVENMIRGVTSGHENTLSLRCLVDGTIVRLILREVLRLARFEPDKRTFCEQHLQITFDERILVITPLTTLNEHACDDDTVIRFSWVRINNNFEVIVEKINGDVVFSGKVL
jgi:hypothetical protein